MIKFPILTREFRKRKTGGQAATLAHHTPSSNPKNNNLVTGLASRKAADPPKAAPFASAFKVIKFTP